ncbi:Peptidase M14 carboxypeptidase A [Trinorchestia longiramus]|nr:Peptidase M14 carboxypeptidase A [Trinorchestia longiramus]
MFQCGKYFFAANFECANLASVSEVPPTDGCTPNNLCSACHLRTTKPELRSSSHVNSPSCSPATASSQLQSSRAGLARGSPGTPSSARKSLRQSVQEPASVGSCKNASLKRQSSGAARPQHNTTTPPLIQPHSNKPDHEFQLYTAPDCANTAYENTNRTWFFFSITGGVPGDRARLLIMNLNKQVKLYSQGMKPVWMQVKPGVPVHSLEHWTRCPVPVHCWNADGNAILSWIHTTPADAELVTYYAFTFPYSYTQLQHRLAAIDSLFHEHSQSSGTKSDSKARVDNSSSKKDLSCEAGCDNLAVNPARELRACESALCNNPASTSDAKSEALSPSIIVTKTNAKVDDVYYVRELVVKSIDSKRLDLLTVSSYLGITNVREDRLPHLFPDGSQPRPFKFKNKKYVFISARVHPGETPSSFVFNGFLDFILSDDIRACKLRNLYVFKLVPMLNPDGVVRGHYRTDQYGVNLNRVYCNPNPKLHPTIDAVRALLAYYHSGSCHSSSSMAPQPPLIDEDTCHSFSDANAQQDSKGSVGPRVNVSMDLDEPSASGWDISSNQSVDSTMQSSALFFKGLDLPDLHDDCSNISGVSETGVTSMFGALAASVSDPDSYSSFPKPDGESLSDRYTRVGRLGHFTGPTTRSRSTAHALPPLTEHNLKLHSFNAPSDKQSDLPSRTTTLSPFEVSATRDDSTHDSSILHPPASSDLSLSLPIENFSTPISKPASNTSRDNDFTPPSRPSLFSESLSSRSGFRFSPSSSFFRVPATTTGGTSVPTISSSESEAEVGEPGREGTSLHPAPSLGLPASCAASTFPSETHKGFESGLHMYVDLHGHASKRGIFLYGNWFPEVRAMVDNLLLAKLLAINCGNFDFTACNFTEKNMSVKDRRNGLSKEGSGRVAIMRLTGLLRSYTLECNYNTGRSFGAPPPLPQLPFSIPLGDAKRLSATSPASQTTSPPKYTPAIFEECGKELAVSILDSIEEAISTTSFRCFDSAEAGTTISPGEKSCNLTSPSPSVSRASNYLPVTTVGSSSEKVDRTTEGPRIAGGVGRATKLQSSARPGADVPRVTHANPLSRLPASPYGSLDGVKLWLRNFLTSPSSSLHSSSTSSVLQSPLSSRKSPARVTAATSQTPLVRNRPCKGRISKGGSLNSPSSSPKSSPKVLRSKSQSRIRRLSWTSVDAENREPVAGCSSGRSTSKYGLGSCPKVKTHKLKATSPKKSVPKALMFTDIEEACSSAKSGKKLSKVRAKHSLTSSVSLTPNLDVHLSISDAPGSPKMVKKVEKVRRERSKIVGGSFKKLKTGCGQSLRSPEIKEETEAACQHEEIGSPSGSPCVSPRSPLSCVYQGSVSEAPRAVPTVKPLKLPGKRRSKVAISLSQSIAAKSLDVLPSSASIAGCSETDCSSSATSKTSLGFCTQSSPDLKSGVKVARKKLRLKSGSSGSESDISALQDASVSIEMSSLPWLSSDTTCVATPAVASRGSVSTLTRLVPSPATIKTSQNNPVSLTSPTTSRGLVSLTAPSSSRGSEVTKLPLPVASATKAPKSLTASGCKPETSKKKKRKIPVRNSL